MTRRRKLSPPRLLVYGVSVESWTRRYGVVPFTTACYDCGRSRTTSVPFVEGTVRGLCAPPCECGDAGRAPFAVILGGPHGWGALP